MCDGKLVLALSLLVVAVYTDIKKGKIYNMIMVSGFIAAYGLIYLEGGSKRCLEAFQHSGVLFLVLFLLFLIKGIGGGDVKLMVLLTVLFPENGFSMCVTSFLISGLFIIIRMGYRKLKKEIVYKRGETIRFSIAIAIAFAVQVIQFQIID